jgi:hypothetical protein
MIRHATSAATTGNGNDERTSYLFGPEVRAMRRTMVFSTNQNEDAMAELVRKKPQYCHCQVIRWSRHRQLFAIFCADHKVRIFDHVSGRLS